MTWGEFKAAGSVTVMIPYVGPGPPSFEESTVIVRVAFPVPLIGLTERNGFSAGIDTDQFRVPVPALVRRTWAGLVIAPFWMAPMLM